MKKLYVGNLPYEVTEEELKSHFGEFGAVESVKIITDRETQRSKGFGFIEMDSEDGAQKAIEGLNGKELFGRPLKIDLAKPMEKRDNRGGGNRKPYNNHRED